MSLKLDLTKGNIFLSLIRFATPLFFANILQSLYSIVDMIVVGYEVGESGVAAISNASTITFLIIAVCIGLTTGTTVLIAHYKGAGNKQGQRDILSATGALLLLIAGAVTAAGLFSCSLILELMNVPSVSAGDAEAYLFVIFIGTFFLFGYNATNAVLRGFGDSMSPLLFVGIATIINIFFDIAFVVVMESGTVGAAYATVIAQGVAFLVSMLYLKKNKFYCDLSFRSFRLKTAAFISIAKISLPVTIQMVVVNLSYLVIAVMLNGYGVAVAAASGIGLKINTLVGMSCWAVGSAITTMVAQNMGAQSFDRVKKIVKVGVLLNLLIIVLFVICVQFFAPSLMILFGEEYSSQVVSIGVEYLRICCFWNSLVYVVMYSFDSFMIGVGFPILATINALLDAVFIRLLLCLVLSICFGMGYQGIFWGQALAPIVPACIGWLYYMSKKWERLKIV